MDEDSWSKNHSPGTSSSSSFWVRKYMWCLYFHSSLGTSSNVKEPLLVLWDVTFRLQVLNEPMFRTAIAPVAFTPLSIRPLWPG